MKYQDLYPFTSHWQDLDGYRYHYLDEGRRDAPPLVMLHGNPTWSFYYRTLIPALSKTHRVIVPDHMGCGLSDKPQQYDYHLAQHIRNVEQLISALNLRDITLVVHDWGGAIGFGYAVRFPANIARLVIFNTAAFYVPKIPLRIALCRIPYLGAFLVRGLNGFARAALIFATSQPERFTPEVRAGYLAPYQSWAERIAHYRFVQDIPLETTHPTRAVLDEIERGLGQFCHHPVLIIWGADDFCFTRQDFLPRWQKIFPAAKVHVLANAGHYVVEDAHERILPLLNSFLTRTSRNQITVTTENTESHGKI